MDITKAMLRGWRACYDDAKLDRVFRGRKALTPADLLALKIPALDKLWVLNVRRNTTISPNDMTEVCLQVVETSPAFLRLHRDDRAELAAAIADVRVRLTSIRWADGTYDDAGRAAGDRLQCFKRMVDVLGFMGEKNHKRRVGFAIVKMYQRTLYTIPEPHLIVDCLEWLIPASAMPRGAAFVGMLRRLFFRIEKHLVKTGQIHKKQARAATTKPKTTSPKVGEIWEDVLGQFKIIEIKGSRARCRFVSGDSNFPAWVKLSWFHDNPFAKQVSAPTTKPKQKKPPKELGRGLARRRVSNGTETLLTYE